MLYRDLHDAVDSIAQIDTSLRQAILAGSAREMTERAEEAEVAVGQVVCRLQSALNDGDDPLWTETPDGRTELVFARAAVGALQQAAAQMERGMSGSDIVSVRAALLDSKTRTDFAQAYLRASIGEEQT